MPTQQPSRGEHSAAVNHVFGAGAGSGARRRSEGDEIRYFLRPSGASDGDAAESESIRMLRAPS